MVQKLRVKKFAFVGVILIVSLLVLFSLPVFNSIAGETKITGKGGAVGVIKDGLLDGETQKIDTDVIILIVAILETIRDNTHIPPMTITDSKLYTRRRYKKEKSILQSKKLRLSHHDTLSSEFATLNYSAPTQNPYAYKIEGPYEAWIQLKYKNETTLTPLPHGECVLRVKDSNNDGILNEKGTSIKIIITPPFYSPWWSRLLVLLTVVVLFYLWHHSRMKHLTLRLKTEKEMEQIDEKYNISPREKEILNLIMKGKTNREIEDILFISLPTVKTHISNIYKKFAVKNRLELIRLIQLSMR